MQFVGGFAGLVGFFGVHGWALAIERSCAVVTKWDWASMNFWRMARMRHIAR
jgi:hypothetical protein